MTSKDIREKLVSIVADTIDTNPAMLTDATSFQEDLCADSLDGVEMLMAVEEEFGIAIPDEAIDECRTFGDMFNYVKGRLGVK